MQPFTMLRAIFAILSQTLTKLHDAVSALTRFLEFKPDHMYGCILDRQACMPTFMTFWAILTPFKPYPIETAWRSFTFEQFLEFKFDHKFGCPFDEQAYMQTFETFQKIFTGPLSPALAKPQNGVSCLTNFSRLKFNRRFIGAFGR